MMNRIGSTNKKIAASISLAVGLLIPSFGLAALPSFSTGESAVAQTPVSEDPYEEALKRIRLEIQSEEIADETFRQIENLAEEQPNDYRVRILLGKCLQVLGMPEQAVEQLDEAVRLAPDLPEPIAALIECDLKSGHSIEAEALLEKAKLRFPDSPEINYWLGTYYWSIKNFKRASELFTSAMHSGKTVLGLPTAAARIAMKDAALQKGPFRAHAYYQLAINLTNQDLKLDPKYYPAHEVKGIALLKSGRIAEAIEPLRKAFEAHPSLPDLQIAYAQCLFWDGNYEAALYPALTHLSQQSQSEHYESAKEMLLRIIDRLDRDSLKKGIDAACEKPMIGRRAALRFALGQILDERNYHLLAIEQYRVAVELLPELGMAWFRLGMDEALYQHDYKDAIESYKNGARYAFGNPEIATNLRRLEDRLGQRHSDLAWQAKDMLKLNSLISR